MELMAWQFGLNPADSEAVRNLKISESMMKNVLGKFLLRKDGNDAAPGQPGGPLNEEDLDTMIAHVFASLKKEQEKIDELREEGL